jgi:hypothetical protein
MEEARRARGGGILLRRATGVSAGVLCLIAAIAGPVQAAPLTEHVPSATSQYSLAGGCFVLRSQHNSMYAVKAGAGYTATAATAAAAEPFRMQPTDLGKYLLYGPGEDFMGRNALTNAVEVAGAPSDNTDWTVAPDGSAFRMTVAGNRELAVGAANALVTVAAGSPTSASFFRFELVDDARCADYPEAEVNITGPLPTDQAPGSQVNGTVETHMHGMAYEFLGTAAHCGDPWHRFGAPVALLDCVDHGPTGCSAVLEQALSGPGCHDPGGWPTFAGWPRHTQYTHEQSYYKWVERAWRGGLRIWVNLMVENRVLCELYPLPSPGTTKNCNEMDSVRRQVDRIHDLEDYIDAQWGGPGKGWYRIVESPEEARAVINDGKLAVIKGMEVSEPFNCRMMASPAGDMPLCTESQLDAGIDELYDDLGIRQVELVNKFDNALTGVAGDGGTTGSITSLGNLYSAGTFWDLEQCPAGPDDPAVNHDHSPTALSHNDDAVVSAIIDLFDVSGITPPVYGAGPHCNQRGLSTLGERAIRRLMSRGMLFDPDHMSVLARNKALDLVEAEKYPGVMTSHSWSTDNALPRISKLGGLIGPAAKSPAGFYADWKHIRDHGYDDLNPYTYGFGYGADMNGFASQGGPPPVDKQITYPFQSPIDPTQTVNKQRTGTFEFDFNALGTAHYGLYADWGEAVRIAAGADGDEIIGEMRNAAEAYLQMWERSEAAAAGGAGSGGGSDAGAGAGAAPSSGKACATKRVKVKPKQPKAKKKPKKKRKKKKRKICSTLR